MHLATANVYTERNDEGQERLRTAENNNQNTLSDENLTEMTVELVHKDPKEEQEDREHRKPDHPPNHDA